LEKTSILKPVVVLYRARGKVADADPTRARPEIDDGAGIDSSFLSIVLGYFKPPFAFQILNSGLRQMMGGGGNE
jgi:hypothetical protein